MRFLIHGRKYRIAFIIMLFCIFCFTAGQFVPIYFMNNNVRGVFYLLIWLLLVVTSAMTIYAAIYMPEKKNGRLASLMSALVALGMFVVFGLFTAGLSFAVWTEASIYYVRKDSKNVKIISRYINEGAFGGGTEKGDFHMVLSRPFLGAFKIETSVDTAKIDKRLWVKHGCYDDQNITGIWYSYGSRPEEYLDFGAATVAVTNKGVVSQFKYAVLNDSLIMTPETAGQRKSYKLLLFTKEALMIQDDNAMDGGGKKIYYRTRK
jgi:hypothetical protein